MSSFQERDAGSAYEEEGFTPISTPPIPEFLDPRLEKKRKRKVQEVTRNAGQVLHTITSDSITPITADITWDRDPELLCSYNWQDSTDGTNVILVPGAPPRWAPPTLPYTVALDSGIQYTDHNYARQPKFPYKPMFHALAIMNPTAQFLDVDVLADRNNLRTLLEFVQGKKNGPFCLNLHLVDNTLMLVRRQDRYWSTSDGVGYGHNFENHFTRAEDGMQNASSHYRVIKYPMGPLNIVMRFEADAYLAPPDPSADQDAAPEAIPFIPVTGGTAQRARVTYSAPITAIAMGSPVHCLTIVELKTTAHREDGKSDGVKCMDQLWFGRTPHLYTGVYEKGTGVFQRVRYNNTMERVAHWEENNQEGLRKLVALLMQLKAMLKLQRGPIRACVLSREEKDGPLKIREMQQKNYIVTHEIFQKHWQRERAPQPFQQRENDRFQPRGRGQGQSRGRGQVQSRGGGQVQSRGNSQYPARGASQLTSRGNASFSRIQRLVLSARQ